MHGQQAGPGQGEAVLAQALAAFQTALGPRLTAAYALGSLAHGGFSPLVSDVDLGLVLDDPFRIKDRFTIRSVTGAVPGRRIAAAPEAFGVLGDAVDPAGHGERRQVPPARPA